MNPGNACNRAMQYPRSHRWLAGISLLALSGTAWSANALQVTSDGLLSMASGEQSQLQLRIRNTGSQPLSDLRWVSSLGSLQCARSTDFGRGFIEGGALAAGDALTCALPAEALGRSLSAGVAVRARDSSGQVQVQHASVSLRTPRAPLNQGAIVVLAGAVHADANSNGLYETGETIAYHYSVTNAGTLPLSAIALSDVGGAVTCPQTTLASAAFMTCTRSYVVTAGDQSAGLIVNPINATATASNGPVVGSDVIVSINLGGSASVRVFKSPQLQDDVDGDGRASVGDLMRYAFLTKNSGAQTLTGVNLTEPDATRIDTPIVCSPTTLNGQPLGALGSATLQSNDIALCSADYSVRVGDAVIGQASNLVIADANAAIGGPVNGSGASTVVIPANPQIAVTKTVSVASTPPGGSVVYTVTVSNVGVTDVGNVVIADPLPIGISAFAWTCVGTGATCPAASGSGAINQTVALFPAGGQLRYSVTATVAANAPGNVINTVTITPPGITVCMPGSTLGPCTATVPLVVDEPYIQPSAIPVNSRWAIVLMILGLTMAALRWQRTLR